MRASLVLLALASASPALAALTRQDKAEPRTAFVADADGDYKQDFVFDGSCPSDVSVSGTEGTDKAVGQTPVSNIEFDGKACAGGTMYTVSETVARSPELLEAAGLGFAAENLRKNPAAFTVVNQPRNTEVLVGFDDEPRTCGGKKWGTDTFYFFVKETSGDQPIQIDTKDGKREGSIAAGEKGMLVLSSGDRQCLMTAPATVTGKVKTTGQDEEDAAASAEASDEDDDVKGKSAEASDEDDGSACFPADATVTTPAGPKRMADLAIGDLVATAHNTFSPVFAFTHRDAAHTSSSYIRLTTASGAALTLTPGHYLYVNAALSAARAVRAGDVLTLASGAPDAVTAVEAVEGTGLYNPQTLHGDILVDGFRASTYTTAVEPSLAHAALAPMRALARVGAGMGWAVLEKGADRIGGLVRGGEVCAA